MKSTTLFTTSREGNFPPLIIALAAEAYAKAHRLGIDSENHAREIKFLAARRIGELMPATPPEIKGKRAHGKELPEVRATEIPKQHLSEFRKLVDSLRGPF